MASRRNGTLYTGVTSNLLARTHQHREGLVEGFTKKYGCKLLVWFDIHNSMESAIVREKQLKKSNRNKKLALIETLNPQWEDFFETLLLPSL